MLDAPDAAKAAVACTEEEAPWWNTPERGWGIFRTVNEFHGPRQKDYLVAVRGWAVDLDDGTKAEQRARLHRSPVVPTLVVETKRGYQAHFAALSASQRTWEAIVRDRLVPFFKADPRARDLCRILRAPGYWHLKDPSDPFLCREVYRSSAAYTERQMLQVFPDLSPRDKHEAASKAAVAAGAGGGQDFWQAIYEIDCEDFLTRVSGTGLVGGEVYSFRRTSKGRKNIFVDKKSTSCFVDENGRIGSLNGGGPTPYNWLRWFGHQPKTIVEALKSLYPHLDEIDKGARR